MSDYCATPEERQEVAAKLREAGRELDGDNTSSIRSAFCEIDHIIGTQDTGRTFEPFFDRLADLIDPVCDLDLDFCMEYIVCQSCGYELPHGTHLDETKYCPNCGSRVVIEDE